MKNIKITIFAFLILMTALYCLRIYLFISYHRNVIFVRRQFEVLLAQMLYGHHSDKIKKSLIFEPQRVVLYQLTFERRKIKE